MAKYYGMIGFSLQKETRPGVWQEIIHEHPVFGDVYKNTKVTENGGQVNDSIVLNSQISFIADSFATENSHNIKYVTYLGTKWAVKSIDIQFPRLVLTLGGVYNEKQPTCYSR